MMDKIVKLKSETCYVQGQIVFFLGGGAKLRVNQTKQAKRVQTSPEGEGSKRPPPESAPG